MFSQIRLVLPTWLLRCSSVTSALLHFRTQRTNYSTAPAGFAEKPRHRPKPRNLASRPDHEMSNLTTSCDRDGYEGVLLNFRCDRLRAIAMFGKPWPPNKSRPLLRYFGLPLARF